VSEKPEVPLDDDAFEGIFSDEFESWFSADIACCENCYESYLDLWPAAKSDSDFEFEKNQIEIGSFFEGSRIKSFYTRDQFDRLIGEIDCPRCGAKLGGLLFPYNLPFDVPKDFEDDVEEIISIGEQQPFLMLNHPFAKEVFSVIEELGVKTSAMDNPDTLFRARSLAGLQNFDVGQFDFAPPEYVGEGRYNHAGNSILYLGDSEETCFHELRRQVCAIAELSIDEPIKILDLANPYDSHIEHPDLLNSLVFSALLSAPRNETHSHKPEYVFSRFLSDCASSAGFDAIKYPSTQKLGTSFNLALLNKDFAIGSKSKFVKLQIFDGTRARLIET